MFFRGTKILFLEIVKNKGGHGWACEPQNRLKGFSTLLVLTPPCLLAYVDSLQNIQRIEIPGILMFNISSLSSSIRVHVLRGQEHILGTITQLHLFSIWKLCFFF